MVKMDSKNEHQLQAAGLGFPCVDELQQKDHHFQELTSNVSPQNSNVIIGLHSTSI